VREFPLRRTCWRIRILLTICLALASQQAAAQSMTVTLLGTGYPEPLLDRFGPGTLIEARGQRFLFDAGRGVAQRIWEMNVPLGTVRHVFLTHLHSDHVVGLPDAWLTGWLRTAFGRRTGLLHVYGPAGTRAMVSALRQAFDVDVRQRTDGVPDSTAEMIGHDVAEGVVYDRDEVKVTAFTVDHGNPPIAALGYRIETGGRSVTISGDTRKSENLIRHARQTDVLIHEVMAVGPGAQATPAVRRILDSHTSPEDAADVFSRAQPRLAVFTHVGILSAPALRPEILDGLLARTRALYPGRVVVGEDRMTITVDDSIRVTRRPP
jgi:ribonuclease Z